MSFPTINFDDSSKGNLILNCQLAKSHAVGFKSQNAASNFYNYNTAFNEAMFYLILTSTEEIWKII